MLPLLCYECVCVCVCACVTWLCGGLRLQRERVQELLVDLDYVHVRGEILAHAADHQILLIQTLGTQEGAPPATLLLANHSHVQHRRATCLAQGPDQTQRHTLVRDTERERERRRTSTTNRKTSGKKKERDRG